MVNDQIIEFLNKNLVPFLYDEGIENNSVIVIGGSYSYGLNDKNSDIDVYIYMESKLGMLVGKCRQHLFNHIVIGDSKVQIIPQDLNSPMNSVLKGLLNGKAENLKNIDVKTVHELNHYITLFDLQGKIAKTNTLINTLGEDFWDSKCQALCCETIDLLEAFYSSLNRCNVAAAIKFGNVVQSLLRILFLTDGKPYPPDKWLYKSLDDKHKSNLNEQNDSFLPENFKVDNLKECVDMINHYTVGLLTERGKVPKRILDDMLSP